MDVVDYVREVLHDKGVIGWPDWLPFAMQDAIYEECLYLADDMLAALGDGTAADPLTLEHGAQRPQSATNGPFQWTVLTQLEREGDTAGGDYAWRDWLLGRFRSIRSERT